MLEILTDKREYFDDQKQEFIYIQPTVVQLEHSLLSIAKWESKWKKPFLTPQANAVISGSQLLDYFRCMEVVPSEEPQWIMGLRPEQIAEIKAYINDEKTATTFCSYRKEKQRSREILTSEVIYYWMTALQIPFSCETWHLSRLLTLIHVASLKGQKGKKMSKRETMEFNRNLNEERKRKYNTKG